MRQTSLNFAVGRPLMAFEFRTPTRDTKICKYDCVKGSDWQGFSYVWDFDSLDLIFKGQAIRDEYAYSSTEDFPTSDYVLSV